MPFNYLLMRMTFETGIKRYLCYSEVLQANYVACILFQVHFHKHRNYWQ